MKSKSNTAFNGVIVLTIALIVVKILSAIYRVPYQNVLGDSGLYAYQQIYPIVALGVILSMNAIPSALTQTFGTGRNDAKFASVLIKLQCVCVAFFLILFTCAKWIAKFMGDVNLAPMISAASASFIFFSALGVLRGYYQSKQEMNIPAISQVVEQVVRVVIIMAAITLFAYQGWSIYAAGTLAILGSGCGFLASSLYLVLHKPFQMTIKNEPIEWKKLSLAIIVFAVSQLIVILWQVVDSFTVIHALKLNGLDFQHAISSKGVYDRGASFIQMGLIVTTTFCFVLIPLLTNAKNHGQFVLMNRYTNASLKITLLISAAAGIGLINLLPVLNRVFFENNSETFTLAVYMLTVICVSLIMMEMSLLQVMNQEKTILISCVVGLILKSCLNIILIPYIQMLGASIATVASLVITAIILHVNVKKFYRLSNLKQFLLKLIGAMIIMSVVVQIVLWLIPTTGRLTGLIELLLSAMAGIIVMVSAIIWMNLFKYRELKHLPLGDKIYHIKRGKR
ncbi:polysaccharide biosynthesis protein [Staphylococcus durrellii]|uniref:polysaccharide biosynthesis protein n=1 Tax=Staphylococcus durrellii TaxID=2781773 RepID=UPI0018A0EFBE|nr:polysaccharide biosynthesis protein [Staphylococcus durrellii]MBF7017901.1 polysaccharide biosynthesis protein [Staphylococcus durrellii]